MVRLQNSARSEDELPDLDVIINRHRKQAAKSQTKKTALPITEDEKTLRTRSSPRKKDMGVATIAKTGGGSVYLHSANLVPEPPPRSSKTSKQIRLKPMHGITNGGLLGSLQFREIQKSSETVMVDSSTTTVRGSTARKTVGPVPAEDKSSPSEYAYEVDHEVEESIWCGSTSGSEHSEEELPSPRKLSDLAGKPSRRKPKLSPRLPDLALDFGALRLSQDDSDGPVMKKSVAQAAKILDSRPTSSSDKEINDRAMLRFSPPRLYSPRKFQSSERPTTPPPASPSKSRLLSPSKKKPRIPTPPLRPSLDAFWNVDTVNDWNDQYSPQKVLKSPKKSRIISNDDTSSPSVSPRKSQSPAKRDRTVIEARKDFETRKHRLAEAFLIELDDKITGGTVQELAATTGGVQLVWSKTLKSTAGRANWRRETTRTRDSAGASTTAHKHHASIELAEKVIDEEDRLLNVIAHEFCHLANFMVSGIKDQPHGRQFKEWGRKCTLAFGGRGVEVTTKHSYQIEYKYIWQCSNDDCESEFKRHSKSIDPKRHTCGSCRNKLVQVKPVPRKDAGTVTGYAAFVKEHFASIKANMPGASQKEVMEAVGRQYREQKSASTATKAGVGIQSLDDVARKLEFVTLDDD